MRLRSLGVRLSLWYAVVCLAVCAAFAAGTYFWLREYMISTVAGIMDRRAKQIAALWKLHEGNAGEQDVINDIKISYAPEQNDRFVRISRADGTVVYISGQPADKAFVPARIPLQPVGDKPEVRRLPAQNMLIASRRFDDSGVSYVVDVGTSLESTTKVQHAFLIMLLLSTPVVVVIAVTGGFILVQKSLEPVREIAAAAQDITYRNPKIRLPVAETGDEIEHLAVVLNQMLSRLEAAYEVSQRFGAMASHELRTPLTIIIGELEALLRIKAMDSGIRDRIGSVFEEAERLIKIVEGLFAITRLEAGAAHLESAEFDLSALVKSTSEQMALLADEAKLSVRCETEEGLGVLGDRARIKQVVVNLLDNAIKYSRPGGTIQLKTFRDGEEAVFRVFDEGSGIPEEDLPHVFESFYRAENELTRRVEGAGLGLSMVKSICEAHRGTVEAANRPEGGCVVSVRMPLQKTRKS